MMENLLNLNHIKQYRNMPELVAESLKEAILRGEFKGGVQLKQDEIAKKYDVSLIPVREALIQLESKHLVRCIRNKGTVVRTLNISEMRELFALKRVLEMGSVMLLQDNLRNEIIEKMQLLIRKMEQTTDPFTFGRYDKLFHQLLCDCAGNSELSGMYEKFFVRIERYLIYMYHLIPEISQNYSHHQKIVEGLKIHNIHLLEAEIKVYSESLMNNFTQYIENKGYTLKGLDWNVFLPFN